MFCPKCGTQNPNTGKFCRSCGTDLDTVNAALTGKLRPTAQPLVDRKGKPVSYYESSVTKLFTGAAFVIIALVLAFTGVAGGSQWWFWMLIPGFASLGAGIAQYMTLQKNSAGNMVIQPTPEQPELNAPAASPSLPPDRAEHIFNNDKERYKTGDLVPPSVTDGTTKLLEIDKEGRTMTLPKQ